MPPKKKGSKPEEPPPPPTPAATPDEEKTERNASLEQKVAELQQQLDEALKEIANMRKAKGEEPKEAATVKVKDEPMDQKENQDAAEHEWKKIHEATLKSSTTNDWTMLRAISLQHANALSDIADHIGVDTLMQEAFQAKGIATGKP